MKKPKKRSEKLRPDEMEALNRLREENRNDTQTALQLGIGRETLLRLCMVGSASPLSITRIRKVLKTLKSPVA